jgi:hypothetical protein
MSLFGLPDQAKTGGDRALEMLISFNNQLLQRFNENAPPNAKKGRGNETLLRERNVLGYKNLYDTKADTLLTS